MRRVLLVVEPSVNSMGRRRVTQLATTEPGSAKSGLSDPDSILALENVRKRSFLESWEDFLYGYDFFISYRWKDGRDYAIRLSESLRAAPERFSVFLDSREFAVGDSLSGRGNRAVRKTSRLVLVASPLITESEHVKRELTVFRATDRRILTIDFDGTLDEIRESDPVLRSLLGADELSVIEPRSALVTGPGDAAVEAVRNSLITELKRERRQRSIAYACVTLALLAVLAVVAAIAATALYRYKKANDALAEMGATFGIDESVDGQSLTIGSQQDEGGETVDLSLIVQWVDDAWLLSETRAVHIIGRPISNLSELERFPNLMHVNLLNSSNVDSLEFAGRTPQLQKLHLNNTGINDAVLKSLSGSGELVSLRLTNNQISSAEVGRLLEQNPHLRLLDLDACRELTIPLRLADQFQRHAESLKRKEGSFFNLRIDGTDWRSHADADFVSQVFETLSRDGHVIEDGADNDSSKSGGV